MAEKRVSELSLRTAVDMANDKILLDNPTDGTFCVTPDGLLNEVYAQIKDMQNQINTLSLNLEKQGSVIINQYYGGSGGSVSHNFIELYNVTDEDIDLAGKSLQYVPVSGEAVMLELEGIIPAHCSFLILGNEAGGTGLVIEKEADLVWEGMSFANKGIGFLLMDNVELVTDFSDVMNLDGYLDGMSSDDSKGGEGAENIPQFAIGEPSTDQSKQKSIRKHIPVKSKNNRIDCYMVDYRIESELKKAPKCVADGPWYV